MNSEENNDIEIVMGGDSDLEISEVGDIMNDLKPNTNKEKKPIIIPVSMKKSQNTNSKKNNNTNNESETVEKLDIDENEKDLDN